MFLGDKQFAGSVKLTPVDNATLKAEFQSRVLRVDANRYASIWSKRGLSRRVDAAAGARDRPGRDQRGQVEPGHGGLRDEGDARRQGDPEVLTPPKRR